LVEFVKEVRAALGDNVVGVYLQGSFALGAADEWSDVDFIVAVDRTVIDLTPLNAIHAHLYQQPVDWAKHLEGSYIPIALLRQVDPSGRPCRFSTTARRGSNSIHTVTPHSSVGFSATMASVSTAHTLRP
jgi:predicted nucleotidyltransferase